MPYLPSLGTSAAICARRKSSELGRPKAGAASCPLPPWLARLPAESRPRAAAEALPARRCESLTDRNGAHSFAPQIVNGADRGGQLADRQRCCQVGAVCGGSRGGRVGGGGQHVMTNDPACRDVPSMPPKWSAQRS